MIQPTDSERRGIITAVFGESLASHALTPRFKAYFDHYTSVVCPASAGDAVIELDTPALTSHADVLGCVKTIIQNPTISFNQFLSEAVFPRSSRASPREKKHVGKVAVGVAFAIDTTLDDHGSTSSWEGDVSFADFVEGAFRSPDIKGKSAPEGASHDAEFITRKTSLKAWKLTKRYGIRIRGTSNLLDHLVFDRKAMTLKVFHQVSFLRAHLAKGKGEPLDLGFEESLKRGTLPPRLLLETLLTFHDVLFPVASVRDKKSRATLETLIQKQGFDPEARWIEFVRATPADMRFDYWGNRLSALHRVVRQPPPSNAIVAWFERHTSERNALTVAILALVLSVLFGLLSFIVGLLQLVLAWVAYRNSPSLTS